MAPKLPMEVWLMIAQEVGAHDDLRSAWHWFRPVCRAAKEATELAVRAQILPRLHLDILNDDQFRDHYGGVRRRDFTQAHFEMAFQQLSADGERAVFRPAQGSTIVFAELAIWDVHYHLWPGVLWHEEEIAFNHRWWEQGKALREQWKKRQDVLEAEEKPRSMRMHFQAYVTGSCAAAIPNWGDMELDPKTLEVSTPWRHLITQYMREGEMIGQFLKKEALEDEERRLRTLRKPGRMEEALKIALSSKPCRRLRFLKALEDAAAERSKIRGIKFARKVLQYHMELVVELDGRDPRKDPWLLQYFDDSRPQIVIPYEIARRWYDEWEYHLLAGVPKN